MRNEHRQMLEPAGWCGKCQRPLVAIRELTQERALVTHIFCECLPVEQKLKATAMYIEASPATATWAQRTGYYVVMLPADGCGVRPDMNPNMPGTYFCGDKEAAEEFAKHLNSGRKCAIGDLRKFRVRHA